MVSTKRSMVVKENNESSNSSGCDVSLCNEMIEELLKACRVTAKNNADIFLNIVRSE